MDKNAFYPQNKQETYPNCPLEYSTFTMRYVNIDPLFLIEHVQTSKFKRLFTFILYAICKLLYAFLGQWNHQMVLQIITVTFPPLFAFGCLNG